MKKNQNDSDRRIRPVVLVGLAFALAVICVPLWLLNHKPAPPNPAEEAAPPAEAPAIVEPALAVVPVASPPLPVTPATPAQPGTLEGEWGIRVSSVGLTMAGSAVDFRYAVVDQEKALLLAQGTAEAFLVDQATGTKLSLTPPALKGPSAARTRAMIVRQGGGFPPSPNRLAAGRTNSLLLPNPAGIVKSGNIVTVVVGNIEARNVVVN